MGRTSKISPFEIGNSSCRHLTLRGSGRSKATAAKFEVICRRCTRSVPFSYVLFAENSEREVGFALYGFQYSSFAGQPSIWLDDLYVDEAMRSQGVGAALMRYLASIADEHDCTHIAWYADARNVRGLQFYRRLGAEITEQSGNRCLLRWISWRAAEQSACTPTV